jgi:hypothetical protein
MEEQHVQAQWTGNAGDSDVKWLEDDADDDTVPDFYPRVLLEDPTEQEQELI